MLNEFSYSYMFLLHFSAAICGAVEQVSSVQQQKPHQNMLQAGGCCYPYHCGRLCCFTHSGALKCIKTVRTSHEFCHLTYHQSQAINLKRTLRRSLNGPAWSCYHDDVIVTLMFATLPVCENISFDLFSRIKWKNNHWFVVGLKKTSS